MKKVINVVRWIGVAYFGIMAVFSLSQGGFLGAILLFIGGALITPLDIVSKVRKKLKLNKALTIVIAIILMFAGILAVPITDIPTDTATEKTSTNSEKTSLTTAPFNEKTESTSKDTTVTESETTTAIVSTTTEPEREETTKKEVTTTKKPIETTTKNVVTTTKKVENSRTIYATAYGEKYHYENPCGNGKYYQISWEDAQRRGLEPCEKCVLH